MAVSTAGMFLRKEFGEALKAARRNARLPDGGTVTQLRAAKAIKRRTVDKVSRFERGAAWPEPAELETLLKLYGADVETSTTLRVLLEKGQAITNKWWQEYEKDFPPSLIRFIAYEDAAAHLTVTATNTVPALLQTEDYARAVTSGVAGNFMPPATVERAVELRRRRRGILTKDNPARVEFIMSQAALKQQTGGRDVMIEQLQGLLDDAKQLPVTLRVISFDESATVMHITHLLHFQGKDAKPVVAYDSPTGLTFETKQKEVRVGKAVVDSLRARALSPHDSIQLIRAMQKEMSSV